MRERTDCGNGRERDSGQREKDQQRHEHGLSRAGGTDCIGAALDETDRSRRRSHHDVARGSRSTSCRASTAASLRAEGVVDAD